MVDPALVLLQDTPARPSLLLKLKVTALLFRHLIAIGRSGYRRVMQKPGLASSLRTSVGPPALVWLVWRLSQACLIWLFDGRVLDAAFQDDGGWYRLILSDGYVVNDATFKTFQNTAFFPGITWTTKPFALVVSDRVAALIVANLWSLAAFIGVYSLIREMSGSSLAWRVTVGLALWPTSFFLWAYYSEGMFVALTAVGLLGIRKERTTISGLAAFGVATTRVVGVGFGVVLALRRWRRMGHLDAISLALAGGSGIGAIAVMAQFWLQTDRPLAFVEAQKAWGREFSAPWTPIVSAISDIIEKLPNPALELSLNLAAVVVVAAALGVIWRRSGGTDENSWALVAWAMPLFTSIVSSQARFALGAWPALLALDTATARGRWLRLVLGLVGLGVSVALLRRFASGAFVA